jgi:integrase
VVVCHSDLGLVSGSGVHCRSAHSVVLTMTGQSRIVGIPQFLATVIDEHIGHYPSEDGYVFTAKEGGPIRHRNLCRRHFRPAVERARTKAIKEDRKDEAVPEDLRFHDLRHTWAAGMG